LYHKERKKQDPLKMNIRDNNNMEYAIIFYCKSLIGLFSLKAGSPNRNYLVVALREEEEAVS